LEREGAWTDHDVILDRAEAERVAHELETAIYVNREGRDISRDVVTTTRVVQLLDIENLHDFQRMNQILTMFRKRINDLLDEHRQAT
jgi:hypothetical protein